MIKLLPCRCVLCTPYNHAPCHFMQTIYVGSSPLAKLSGSFTCYCGNTGVPWNAGYRNKCQHRKLALEMKLLSPLLQVPFLQLIQKLTWNQQKCHPLPRPPSSSAIPGPTAFLSNRISASPTSVELLVRVSTRVVVVVVRGLFSFVTSAICVRIRGRGQRLRRLFTT